MASNLDMTIETSRNPYDPERSHKFFYELEDAFHTASFRRSGINYRSFPGRDYKGFPPLDDFAVHCITAKYCAAKLHRLPTEFWDSEEGCSPYVNMQVQLWGRHGII